MSRRRNRLALSAALAAGLAAIGCQKDHEPVTAEIPAAPSSAASSANALGGKQYLIPPGSLGPRHQTRWPDGSRQQILAEIDELNRQQALAMEAKGLLFLQGTTWLNVGASPQLPGEFAGRVSDVAVDPTNPNRWFIATAGGGIWETTTAGDSWTPRTDSQVSMSCSAVAIATSNPQIVYAGCGQSGLGNGGILKSSNGGATWTLQGGSSFAPTVGATFSDIRIDPANANVAVVGITSFYGVQELGVYKTTDGGTTWTQKKFGSASDLSVDPTSFSRQLVAFGHPHSRGQGLPVEAHTLNGLYRSTDAGNSWTLLDGPGVESEGGVMEIAIAPSQPTTAYMLVANKAEDGIPVDGQLSFYRITNIWTTPVWTALPIPPQWMEDIVVDPTNANNLFAGGYTDLYFFDGTSWTTRTGSMHVDQQSFAWAGSKLLVGNDGGIYSSLDKGLNWTNENANLSITQFYYGAVHTGNAQFALAGAQDNGSQKWTGPLSWQFIGWGDGMSPLVSPVDGYRHYAYSWQGNSIVRTLNGQQTEEFVKANISEDNFFTLLEGCPSNENVILCGGNTLWKNTGFFNPEFPSWTANHADTGMGEIGGVAFAASDAGCGTYAFAGNGGQVFITTNGGSSWTTSLLGGFSGYINDLAFDPTDSNILYATMGDFSNTVPPGHIFKSTNARAATPTWTNISHSVDLPHNAILVDPTAPSTNLRGQRHRRLGEPVGGRRRELDAHGTRSRDAERGGHRSARQRVDQPPARLHLRPGRAAAVDGQHAADGQRGPGLDRLRGRRQPQRAGERRRRRRRRDQDRAVPREREDRRAHRRRRDRLGQRPARNVRAARQRDRRRGRGDQLRAGDRRIPPRRRPVRGGVDHPRHRRRRRARQAGRARLQRRGQNRRRRHHRRCHGQEPGGDLVDGEPDRREHEVPYCGRPGAALGVGAVRRHGDDRDHLRHRLRHRHRSDARSR